MGRFTPLRQFDALPSGIFLTFMMIIFGQNTDLLDNWLHIVIKPVFFFIFFFLCGKEQFLEVRFKPHTNPAYAKLPDIRTTSPFGSKSTPGTPVTNNFREYMAL